LLTTRRIVELLIIKRIVDHQKNCRIY
jgi:hypothetical protein